MDRANLGELSDGAKRALMVMWAIDHLIAIGFMSGPLRMTSKGRDGASQLRLMDYVVTREDAIAVCRVLMRESYEDNIGELVVHCLNGELDNHPIVNPIEPE